MARQSIPRDLTSAAATVALATGELAYDAPKKLLRIGDGTTPGGLTVEPGNLPAKTNPAFAGTTFKFSTPQTLTAIIGGKETKASVTDSGDITQTLGNLLAEMPANGRIEMPACPVVTTQTMTRTGGVSIKGHGSAASRLLLSNGAQLVFNGGSITYPNNQTSIQDMVIYTDDTLKALPMVQIAYSGRDFASGDFTTAYLRNVQMRGSDQTKAFMTGVSLDNCTNFLLDAVKLCNAQTIVTGSTGFLIKGNEQPIDMIMDKCRAYLFDTAVSAVAGGAGLGMEGLFIDKLFALFCNYGFRANFDSVHDVVAITNSNFNCYKKDIIFRNVHNIHVVGNTLYNAYSSPAEATFVGIEINNNDPAFTFPSTNIIGHNRFFGSTATAPSQTGISINASNGASTDTLIDGNQFSDIDFPIQLFSGSARCRVTDTNNFRNYALRVNNLGTDNLVQVGRIPVASLPDPAKWDGYSVAVSDAASPVLGNTVVGGGTPGTPVRVGSANSTWKVGA